MGNIAENRKAIFLKIISSWEGRKLLCDEYFKLPLSIAQLARVMGISDELLRGKFNNVWSLASEGMQLKEGFFATKLDNGYQVRAQQNAQQKMAEFATEDEAVGFFINIFPAAQPAKEVEVAIENILIDYSLRKLAAYVTEDPILYAPVAERAANVGIAEDRMKEVVKNRYVKAPYEIKLVDDRGIEQNLSFATESEMVNYFLR